MAMTSWSPAACRNRVSISSGMPVSSQQVTLYRTVC
jgi:hypothetical protein